MIRFGKEVVKRAAAGRWLETIAAVGAVDIAILDGRHHPCPKCGGTDRFRLIDQDEGACFCNQCFAKKNSDGLAAIGWLRDWDFPTSLKAVAEYLGVPASNGKPTAKKTKAEAGGQGGAKVDGGVYLSPEAIANEVIRRHAARDGQVGAAKLVAVYHYETFDVLRIDTPTAPGEKQNKTFRPVCPVPLSDGRTAWRKGYPPGPRPPFRLRELLAAPPEMVVVVAGEKGVEWAMKLNLTATTCAGGERAVDKTDWSPLARFVLVVILIDNDDTGKAFGAKVAEAVRRVNANATIKIILLPGLPPKGDIVEWVQAGGTREGLLALVQAASALTEEDLAQLHKKRPGRPTIMVGVDEIRVVDEAIQALASREDTFIRGTILANVVREATPPKGISRPKGSPRIAGLRLPTLRERLADSAEWQRFAGEDNPPEATHPPDWAIKAVDARGEWSGVRRLEGITEIPVLRSDGSILQVPGYDEQTGLLFMPQEAFPPIPEKPTAEEALAAVDAIGEVVVDFPLISSTDRSAWLAGLLTPLARYAFHGPAPLTFIDANRPATGKTLLVDAIGMIVSGREVSRMVVPKEDDEVRKRILALALAGDALVLLDNAAGFFGSPALDAALTATSWSDRILGRSQTVTAPLTATFYGTGNNVIFRADTSRRILPIRLETRAENPEERKGFKHPELLAWVRSERPRLAAAALTILAGYVTAGRPDQGLAPWGSFEAWSALVRNAVAWATGTDPAGSRRELMTRSDQDVATLQGLLNGWQELDPSGCGLTVSEALRRVANAHDREYEVFRSVLWEACPTKDGKFPTPRSLGMKLHHLRRRALGGVCFDSKAGRMGEIWLVRAVQ